MRWALADHAFMEADAMVQHVCEAKLQPDSHLFSACVAGAVICYGRPFTESKGLGALPKEMQQFTGAAQQKELQTIHDTLLETRHKLAAHYDLLHAESLHKAGYLPLDPKEIIIELQSIGSNITTTAAHIDPQLLEWAHGLFLYQRERIQKIFAEIGLSLFAARKGQPGTIILKVP